jgi:hypothetical protein
VCSTVKPSESAGQALALVVAFCISVAAIVATYVACRAMLRSL